MKKRKPASKLVAESTANKRHQTWFHTLDASDQKYVKEVVEEMRLHPSATVHSVARQLIAELDLDRKEWTVARTLKEMLANA